MTERPPEISYDEKRQQDIDDEVYKVPAETLNDLLISITRTQSIGDELTRYLTDTILSGNNPVKEPK